MRYTFIKIIGIALLTFLLSISICYAEKRYDEQGDLVTYGALYHEGLFDGYHQGNGISTVSIDDVGYTLREDAILRDSNKRTIALDQFVPGSAVNFFEVDLEITKLWVSADQSRQGENLTNRQKSSEAGESGDGNGASEGADGDLKLENGVWTN
jgi:hypothetical protein